MRRRAPCMRTPWLALALMLPSACGLALTPLPLQAHRYYLTEVALSEPPAALGAAAALLLSRGEDLLMPADAGPDMHPLLVPLTRSPSTGAVTGLIRSPSATGGKQLPLVRTTTHGLELLALDVGKWLQREVEARRRPQSTPKWRSAELHCLLRWPTTTVVTTRVRSTTSPRASVSFARLLRRRSRPAGARGT